MSLAYSGSICATGPAPRVATCQASMNATNNATDTTAARSPSGSDMLVSRRNGSSFVMAGLDRLDPAIHRFFAGRWMRPNSSLPEFGPFRSASRIYPTCVVKPAHDILSVLRALDREALDVVLGLGG